MKALESTYINVTPSAGPTSWKNTSGRTQLVTIKGLFYDVDTVLPASDYSFAVVSDRIIGTNLGDSTNRFRFQGNSYNQSRGILNSLSFVVYSGETLNFSGTETVVGSIPSAYLMLEIEAIQTKLK